MEYDIEPSAMLEWFGGLRDETIAVLDDSLPPVDDDIEEVMDLTGKLANALHRMCVRNGGNTEADFDWNEIATVIHHLQAIVLAQVAARAYPDRFRQLGGRL